MVFLIGTFQGFDYFVFFQVPDIPSSTIPKRVTPRKLSTTNKRPSRNGEKAPTGPKKTAKAAKIKIDSMPESERDIEPSPLRWFKSYRLAAYLFGGSLRAVGGDGHEGTYWVPGRTGTDSGRERDYACLSKVIARLSNFGSIPALLEYVLEQAGPICAFVPVRSIWSMLGSRMPVVSHMAFWMASEDS